MGDDGDYEVEAVSDEEKLNIATHMLMCSPPGQFVDVLRDLRKLMPDSLLTDARAAEIAKAYNAQEGVVVKVGEHGVVLAAEGAVNATHSMESRDGSVFKVDHTKATVVDEGAETGGWDPELSYLEDHRVALQEALDKYRAAYFSGAEESAACVFAKPGVLVAYVGGHKYNLRNWWSGRWIGRYDVTVGEYSVEVSGTITVRGHYFENGNIQLQTSKAVAAKTLPPSDSASLASAVSRYIRDSESALHEGLEDMYERMGDVTLRSMRRAKPITADRFSWNIAQIRMRNTLTANSAGK